MPVRSLSSSVIKWPDPAAVRKAIDLWAREEVPKHPELIRLGYFGSYAGGNWGVGSDLDLIAIVSEASDPFERRALSWSLTSLPTPSELVVYTKKEWALLQKKGGRFVRTVSRNAVWIYVKDKNDSADSAD